MVTTIVTDDSGGDGEAIETLADAVETLAEANAGVIEDNEVSNIDIDHEHRITNLENVVAIEAAAIEQVAETANDAQVTADVAQETANAIIDEVPAVIEETIEATEFIDTDKDGTIDEVDAPDAAPAGSRTHWLDRSFSDWKNKN